MRLVPALLAGAILALPVAAKLPGAPPPPAMTANLPGKPDTRLVPAGTYSVEPKHTQVTFAIDHMGFTVFRGDLSQASGSLTLDPASLTKAALSVTIPIASIHTSSDKLNQELLAADWFDAAQFPQASFVSTTIVAGPNALARVEGNLTLHGVTRPATMLVHFHGAGVDPTTRAMTIGFDGRMTLNRSAFGITKYPDLLSDTVQLTIAGAFVKAG